MGQQFNQLGRSSRSSSIPHFFLLFLVRLLHPFVPNPLHLSIFLFLILFLSIPSLRLLPSHHLFLSPSLFLSNRTSIYSVYSLPSPPPLLPSSYLPHSFLHPSPSLYSSSSLIHPSSPSLYLLSPSSPSLPPSPSHSVPSPSSFPPFHLFSLPLTSSLLRERSWQLG